jgi:type II secretion system protein H
MKRTQPQERSDRPNHANGFTLIEMVAVIAIIGMVFAIGIPRLTSSKLRELRNEAESIATSVEFARQRAIMTGIPHRVLIDLEEGGYRIEWFVDEERAFAIGDDNLAGSDTAGGVTGDAVSGPGEGDENGAAAIQFYPPSRTEREYFPIPDRQLGSFTWLGDARYFVGLESSSGWVEGGDVEIVFDSSGLTEYTLLEIADSSENHLTLEIEPLLDRVRRRIGAARS